MRAIGRLCLCLALGLWHPAGATPGSCTLQQIAALDTIEGPDGAILVPAGIESQPTLLLLDTGAFWSVLRPSLARPIGWHHSSVGMAGAGGEILDQVTTIPDFTLGPLALKDVDFIVGSAGFFAAQPEIGGLLAANLLKVFDLEIDPAGHEVRLFSQDHCKGNVIHWPHTDRIDVPLEIARDGQITIPVVLDGEALRALVDTGAAVSVLHLDVARRRFGIEPGAPGDVDAGSLATADGRVLPRWEHRFHSLAIEGARFNEPLLAIAPNRMRRSADDASGEKPADLELGLRQLRLLHLYIAYGEKMLYATTVGGDAAAARP
jgi:predicted aspartyl protease